MTILLVVLAVALTGMSVAGVICYRGMTVEAQR
jgi:hypothetical protein